MVVSPRAIFPALADICDATTGLAAVALAPTVYLALSREGRWQLRITVHLGHNDVTLSCLGVPDQVTDPGVP